MKNIFKYIIILLSLFFFLGGNDAPQFDPWGVWNRVTIQFDEDDIDGEVIKIRTIGDERYYEILRSGLLIVKEGKNYLYEPEENYPLIAIEGDHTKIEKYESIMGGFIFYLVGEGRRYYNGRLDFQDNTRIQVMMYFINENECYFEYVSIIDQDGFSLPYFPDENVIYKRFRYNPNNLRILQ